MLCWYFVCEYQYLYMNREVLHNTALHYCSIKPIDSYVQCLTCTEKLFQDAVGKEEVSGSRHGEENWKNKNMPCVSIQKSVSSCTTQNIPRKAQLQRLRFSYDWINSQLTKAVDFFSTMYSKILEFDSVKTLKKNILKTSSVSKNSLVWIDCSDLFSLLFSLSIFSSV